MNVARNFFELILLNNIPVLSPDQQTWRPFGAASCRDELSRRNKRHCCSPPDQLWKTFSGQFPRRPISLSFVSCSSLRSFFETAWLGVWNNSSFNELRITSKSQFFGELKIDNSFFWVYLFFEVAWFCLVLFEVVWITKPQSKNYIHSHNRRVKKRVFTQALRVVFSKDQKVYIRGWNMDHSDLDKNWITRAIGHNSG